MRELREGEEGGTGEERETEVGQQENGSCVTGMRF